MKITDSIQKELPSDSKISLPLEFHVFKQQLMKVKANDIQISWLVQRRKLVYTHYFIMVLEKMLKYVWLSFNCDRYNNKNKV